MSEEKFFSIANFSQGISRELAPGLRTRIFPGDRAMLSIVEFEPNAEGELHSHPEEQWGLMLEGEGTRIQDGREVPVVAGDFWLTPGDVEHTFKAGPNGARVLDIFSPPREEYRRAGSGFGEETKRLQKTAF